MAGGRKLMLWTISAMVILAIAVASILAVRHFSKQFIPVIHAVPGETVVLIRPIEMKDLAAFTRNNGQLLGKLSQIPLTRPFINTLNLLKESAAGNNNLSGILQNNELLLSFVKNQDTTLALLVALELKDIMEVRTVNSFLSGHFTIIDDAPGAAGVEIRRITGDPPFFFNVSNGIFSGSTSREVLLMSIEQRNGKPLAFSDPVVNEVMETSGKNVDANIYFNTAELTRLIAPGKETCLNTGFAALDLLVKENGLLLNGFIAPQPGREEFSGMFTGVEPVASSCPSVLPVSTIEFYKLGFNDFDSLIRALGKLPMSPEGSENSGFTSNETRQAFTAWTGGELTMARTGEGDLFAVFSIRKNSDPLKDLGIITRKEMAKVLDNDVYILTHTELLKGLAGPFFGDATFSHFSRLDSHIVFASTIGAMTKVIRAYELGRTLAGSELYALETSFITGNSHLYHYINLDRTLYEKEHLLPKWLESFFSTEGEPHRHFPAFTSQYTFTGKWYYANLSIAFLDSVPEQGDYLWTARLKAKADKGPYLIKIPSSNENFIFISDIDQRAYLFSLTGELIWEVQLSGSPLGIPDVVISGATPYVVFNSTTSLYKIDLAGNLEKGFPASLSTEAASGLSLVKYPDNGDYRMLIPGRDRKMYNYSAAGNEIKGWKQPEIPGDPAGPAQYMQHKKKDYLVFSDQQGNVLITDRRGKKRVDYKGDLSKALHSKLYLNQTNSKGLFITTDIKGHLVYIPEKGRLQETVFGDFSPDHYFLYEDINADGHEDFVYFDNLKMQAFDRFKKKLIIADLTEGPASQPLKLASESKRKSFFYQGTSGRIYQVDHEGNVITEEYLNSDSGFAAWKDKDTGMIFTAVTKDLELILYPW